MPQKLKKIFTVDLTLCSKCQIYGEDFVNFSGLLRKHELYSYPPPGFLDRPTDVLHSKYILSICNSELLMYAYIPTFSGFRYKPKIIHK